MLVYKHTCIWIAMNWKIPCQLKHDAKDQEAIAWEIRDHAASLSILPPLPLSLSGASICISEGIWELCDITLTVSPFNVTEFGDGKANGNAFRVFSFFFFFFFVGLYLGLYELVSGLGL